MQWLKWLFRDRRPMCRHCGNYSITNIYMPNTCTMCQKSQLISPGLYEILEDKDKTRKLYEDIFNGRM